jgi:casein kinase 1
MEEFLEINHKYIIEKVIGEGAFGKIFAGYNKKNREPVAIKMSKTDSILIKNEATILNYLYQHGCRNIPIVFWYGIFNSYYCMVIPLYESSLFQLRSKKMFSTSAIYSIIIQSIDILEHIHKHFVIHRDIKPQNFMVREGELYLIDFGMATFFINTEKQDKTCDNLNENLNGNLNENDKKTITGSPKYISINIHQGQNNSRRDDLISFGYVILYLLFGELEWDTLPYPPENYQENYDISHIDHFNNKHRLALKSLENIETYCNDKNVMNYLKYCYSLKYDEEPKYSSCKEIFISKTI